MLILYTNRWRVERTRPRPGDIVIGNSTRPAMLVAADGQLVERGAKQRAAALSDLAALDGEII